MGDFFLFILFIIGFFLFLMLISKLSNSTLTYHGNEMASPDDLDKIYNRSKKLIKKGYTSSINKVGGLVKDIKESNISTMDKLEKLGDLRDRGVITTDEFNEMKKQILNK